MTVPDERIRTQRIGLGLLISLVIGFGPLNDAALGHGSFPLAVGRYLVCLACSLTGVLTLGHLLDGAPAPEETDEAGAATAGAPGATAATADIGSAAAGVAGVAPGG